MATGERWRGQASGPAWEPTATHWSRSRLARMIRATGAQNIDDFRREAAAHPDRFWELMCQELEVTWRTPPACTLDLTRGAPFAQFFPGAGFNFTEQAIDRWVANGRGDHPALISEGEEGTETTRTYRELAEEMAHLAGALGSLGIGRGDRVGIFMPLGIACAVAMLACARIGAIFTPIFSGYGASAVATRLSDCGARLLITVDGAYRRGRLIDLKTIADEAVAHAPTVERILVATRTGIAPTSWVAGRDVWWDEAIAGATPRHHAEPTEANDPYMIIYTSGTTGRPKGTRHVHGGFPIKAAADQVLLFDIQQEDRVIWYSDPGWMMAPWLIKGPLILGATAVLYDGAIDWPDAGRLWSLVDRHRATVFGIAPTAIRALMTQGDAFPQRYDLRSLRVIGSSGEPWTPEAWWWYFRQIGGERCPVINYSGGTEIAGGIVGCTTIEAQYPCGFTGAVPGMAVAVVDPKGSEVLGTVGELVIRQPWVGMTQSFWGGPPPGYPGHDQDQQAAADARYLATYWGRPGLEHVWVHGDWAEVAADGSWYILGRSDDTIKVAGKRLGPAEVEAAVLSDPIFAEAAACGVPDQIKGEILAVVAVPRSVTALDDQSTAELAKTVADTVANALGRALRPSLVFVVPELPRTRNGKVMRRVVRAILAHDPDLGDLSGLENPAAIQHLQTISARNPA